MIDKSKKLYDPNLFIFDYLEKMSIIQNTRIIENRYIVNVMFINQHSYKLFKRYY